MAENFECGGGSSLLCAENTKACFDDVDYNVTEGFWATTPKKDSFFNNIRSMSLMGFTVQSEESVKEMIERESEHLPRDDYLKRLRTGDLDLSVRREAYDWICKASAHYDFGPLCVCLSMNYFDRFLSFHQLPKGRAWTVQLLAVACLLLAAKMEETKVPCSVDLQVGEPKFVFEAKTIQRMELLVLSTLKWRMQALTPCSFVDYFIAKTDDNQYLTPSISGAVQLILSTTKGIDFLEFRPSEIAAAVAISISGEVQAVNIGEAMPCFKHVEKGRVLKCVELIKDLSLISGSTNANVASASASSVPQSPNGVLDAACLSYKSDDITVGSCANTSQTSSDIKRRKQDSMLPSQVEQHKS